MNLQTEALAKQAAEYAIEFAKQDQELYIPKLMEQFAKLIVRECCDIFVELRTRPADLAVKDVKKHFGVEE